MSEEIIEGGEQNGQAEDNGAHQESHPEVNPVGGAFNQDPENQEGQQQEEGPTWQLDDETQIEGERPEWLPEKYKTAADLAKAYKALQDKLGQAPSEYEVKSQNLDAEFEPLQDALKLAKSKAVPQEVISAMTEAIDKYLDEFKIDYQAEREKLGADYKEQIDIINNWAKESLSKPSYEALFNSLRTAEAFKAMQEIRGIIMNNETSVPNGNQGSLASQSTSADIQAEITANMDKYRDDISYRKELKIKLENALKREGAL